MKNDYFEVYETYEEGLSLHGARTDFVGLSASPTYLTIHGGKTPVAKIHVKKNMEIISLGVGYLQVEVDEGVIASVCLHDSAGRTELVTKGYIKLFISS